MKPVASIFRQGVVDFGFRGARVSYSQYGEDLIARLAFDHMGIEHPRYLDIGANDPFRGNNTALFYQTGSHGTNVEPNPVRFAAFPRFRKGDVNLNVAVLDHQGEADLYVMAHDALSTVFTEEAEARARIFGTPVVRTIRTQVRTVNDILAHDAPFGPPQLLSIDTEGADERILKTLDFDAWSPEVICAETASFTRSARGEKNMTLVRFLESKGYFVFGDTWANTLFVRREAWE